MEILIIIGIVLVSIVAIFLIVALFVKNEYELEREIIINKPNQEVFDYVRHLKNQDNYSKWVMTDANMKKNFKGTDGKVGFVYAWDGNKKAGKGEQEIMRLEEGNRLDVEVRFERPFAGVAQISTMTEAVSENSTRVRWGMAGKNKYPMNIMNLVMQNMLKNDIDTSLLTLKSILENPKLS